MGGLGRKTGEEREAWGVEETGVSFTPSYFPKKLIHFPQVQDHSLLSSDKMRVELFEPAISTQAYLQILEADSRGFKSRTANIYTDLTG